MRKTCVIDVQTSPNTLVFPTSIRVLAVSACLTGAVGESDVLVGLDFTDEFASVNGNTDQLPAEFRYILTERNYASSYCATDMVVRTIKVRGNPSQAYGFFSILYELVESLIYL